MTHSLRKHRATRRFGWLLLAASAYASGCRKSPSEAVPAITTPLTTQPPSPAASDSPSSRAALLRQPLIEAADARTSEASVLKSTVKHVVVLSVDGLAPRYLDQLVARGKAPTFAELQRKSAWTHNARTDKTHTITLPNHTSMVTGLPVSPTQKYGPHYAHRWYSNGDPANGETLHQHRAPAGSYTASMFDVAHDHGLRTAMFASKSKFAVYAQTYNDAGGQDTVGEDNGREKIDVVVIDGNVSHLVDNFVSHLQTNPPALSLVHLNQPDGTGHRIGWGTPEYLGAVERMDAELGKIFAALQSPPLAGTSALILTADHGGVALHHADKTDSRNFQIPFYVFAPGVVPGDAYRVFEHRFAPGDDNPAFEAELQPLRNGDAGNLAVFLLGLPPIPHSVIHSAGLRLNVE
jgi:hypothetical protein